VIGLFESVGFAVVDKGLHQPPSFNGVFTSVQGAGSMIGALISARILRRTGEARMVGTALILVAIGAVGMMVQSIPVAMAGSLTLGLGIPVFLVGWGTAMQRYTSARLQGRVNATASMLVTTPQTLSIATGAALISVVDYRILLLAIFLGMSAAGLILLIRPAGTTRKDARWNTVPARDPAGGMTS
jgi:MFS family permease